MPVCSPERGKGKEEEKKNGGGGILEEGGRERVGENTGLGESQMAKKLNGDTEDCEDFKHNSVVVESRISLNKERNAGVARNGR